MKSKSEKSRRALLQASLLGIGGAGVLQAQPEAWSPKKQVVRRPGQQAGGTGLLSSCIRSGHLLFVSGIGGWYPDRRKEPGDARVQMQSAMQTMKEILEGAGSSMDNVLKVNIGLVDPEKNFAAMNEGYKGFFTKDPPARSYMGTTGFARPGVLLILEAVAYVD